MDAENSIADNNVKRPVSHDFFFCKAFSVQAKVSDDKVIIETTTPPLPLSKKKKNPDMDKNTKKNEKAPLTPIHQFYHDALSDYPVSLRNTKTKGRHAVASRPLDEGTTVCLEQAAAFIVRSQYLDEHCHVCLDTLTAKKLMCSDCQKSFYCSSTCLEKDTTHTIVCSAFSQVDAIGRATDVEADMLRLIALLLARRQRDNENNRNRDQCSKEDEDKEKKKNNPTPYWCVEDLVSHRERSDPNFIKVMTEAGIICRPAFLG